MKPYTRKRQAAAYLVHLYTAIGGIIGLFALFSAADREVRTAFLLLTLTMLIDATDGLLARRVRVWEVLPHFSGAQMDDMIDGLNFIWIGIFIIWREDLLPHPAWLIVPTVAGLYAYAQVNMKTEDNFFLGFPSYWSTVALYLYWLHPGGVIAVLMVVIPTIFTFIPTRYLYPSKNQVLWRTSWGLGVIWFSIIIYMLFQDNPSQTLVYASLFYPAYYMGASFYVEYRIRRTQEG